MEELSATPVPIYTPIQGRRRTVSDTQRPWQGAGLQLKDEPIVTVEPSSAVSSYHKPGASELRAAAYLSDKLSDIGREQSLLLGLLLHLGPYW